MSNQSEAIRKLYQAHRGQLSLVMSHFLLPYLLRIHQEFDGDLTMVIILGEIAHHNVSGHFGPRGMCRKITDDFESKPSFRQELPSCNAFSLAAATGLPRETVRRKIVELEKRGWIERSKDRSVRITPMLTGHFQSDFNFQMMSQLLATADRIRHILGNDPVSSGSDQKEKPPLV